MIGNKHKELAEIRKALEDINLSLKVISHRCSTKEAEQEWLEREF